MKTTYAYDAANHLTAVVASQPFSTSTLFEEHYAVRADGLRTGSSEIRYTPAGGVFSVAQYQWDYDADGHLVEEKFTPLANGQTAAQKAGGTAGNAAAAYDDVFSFDLAGNRTQETINVSTSAEN